MLKLERKLTLDKKTIEAANLTDRFTDHDLEVLGDWVHDGYQRDRQSRYKWERRNEAGMDLALQIVRDKSFPWPGSANIAFPLVTIGILQFHARAYPALINGPDIVKMRIIGQANEDLRAQAERVSTHMSWQCLEQDKSWEEQHDRLLINVPCVGTAFTKGYYSPKLGHNVSELVLARDLVLDYWAKSVEDCPRKTQIIPVSRNDIYAKVLRKTFRDVRDPERFAWFQEPAQPKETIQQPKQDNRAGLNRPRTDENTPYISLEQHVNVDLDQDGYAEPYIITIEENSHCVLRIVCGFDQEADVERTSRKEIISIRAMQYYTKYGFIPSPDGGVMDIGFGVLLGPLNESVNSLINLILDGGVMNTTAGGFLGRGAKMKGGAYTFAPFEWNRVDSSGDDLRKSIFPLPTKEPSNVLFQLLGLLINYSNRVAGAVDITVGENPGQNTPAETARTMTVQGEKVYSSIFKRSWRSMKEEFKKLYILNGLYMPNKVNFGGNYSVSREDYLANPDSVVPAASPYLSSENIAMAQANALKQAAMTTNGYDRNKVEKRWLRAMKVDDIDELFPGEGKVPPLPNFKVQIEQVKQQGQALKIKADTHKFAMGLMEQVRVNNAQILKLEAEALNLMHQMGVQEDNVQISAINAMVASAKQHNDMLLGQLDRMLTAIEMDNANSNEGGKGAGEGQGGVPPVASASDNPAVAQGAEQMAAGGA